MADWSDIQFAQQDTDYIEKLNTLVARAEAIRDEIEALTAGRVPYSNGVNLVDSHLHVVDGRLGVGTSNPSVPLHVVGDVRIDGLYSAEGGQIVLGPTDGYADTTFDSINQYVRIFRNSTDTLKFQVFNSGAGKALLTMPDLPTSATGLSSGDIWRDGTVLKIV